MVMRVEEKKCDRNMGLYIFKKDKRGIDKDPVDGGE